MDIKEMKQNYENSRKETLNQIKELEGVLEQLDYQIAQIEKEEGAA